jgi:acyl-CoA synthetase (AMP-forming)/AMP-acid ligase II
VVKVDANGRYAGDCAVNEIGVVAMHGPGVFSGYLSESHNRGAFVEPGWVNSGDLGRLDEDGYLWITGRAKDLIIRGGHNIDPLPVEEILFQHPSVALAALVGQPDAYAGELPLAYVQLKPDAKTTPGRAGRIRARAHARARRGPRQRRPHRRDAAHRCRQGVQAAIALGRRAPRLRRHARRPFEPRRERSGRGRRAPGARQHREPSRFPASRQRSARPSSSR